MSESTTGASAPTELCPYCRGLGKVQYYHGDYDTCPTCHGSGYVNIPEVAHA